MDKELDILKQDIIELAEQFCGGYVKDYKHAYEKIRSLLVAHNLSLQTLSQKSFSSQASKTVNVSRKKDSLIDTNTEELMAEIKKCRQVIMSQHEKISLIPQLQNELKDSEKKLEIELAKVNNRYKNEIAQCGKEMKQYHKIVAKNSELEEKVKLLNMEVESFRRQFHKEIDSDGRVAQLQELAASRSKEIQKLEIACNRLKVQLTLKTQEIQKQSSKVTSLEQKVEEENKKKLKEEEEKYQNTDSSASLLSLYKKKIEDKDEEIKKLKKRMGKMQRIEAQCRIKEDGFESERKEYLDRIGELNKNNKTLEKLVQQKLGKGLVITDEAKKREGIFHANYENMAELARSATDAYNLMVYKEKSSNRSTRPTTAGASSRGWCTRVSSAKTLHIFT